MILFYIIVIASIGLDMYTKYLAKSIFKINEVEVIKNVLYFTYVENRGAAFGILQNQRFFFIALTSIIIAALIIYVSVKKPKSRFLIISLSFICGGGIGNLIDRIILSYVVDFIDVRIINFAVFNIADSFVVVGSILLGIYILFYEKFNKELS